MSAESIAINRVPVQEELNASSIADCPGVELPTEVGDEAMQAPGLPPSSPDAQIKAELLALAATDPDAIQLEVALKKFSKRYGVSIRVLKPEYETQRRKIELENMPPPVQPTPEELAAAEAIRKQQEAHQKEVELAAEELALSPNIFEEFAPDLRKRGYIASKNQSSSMLMTHGARLLDHVTAFMVAGASGSGKSDLIDKAADFLPPETVRPITSASAQAMYYMGDLSGQYVKFGEMQPIKDGEDDYRQMAWRQLVSEGRITRATVEKTDGRTNALTEKETKGPCVLIAATTTEQNNWNDEFANRTSWLGSSDSVETTTKVLDLVASDAEQPWESEDISNLTARWHFYHRNLKPIGVIIPYAKLCAPRSRHVTVRRLFKLLLTYVKISALLHQKTRVIEEHNSKEFIVATEQDYRIAYELLTENAPRVLEPCSDPAIKAFDKLKPKLMTSSGTDGGEEASQPPLVTMSTGQIQKHLGQPGSTIRRWLYELTNAGLLTLVSGFGGRQHVYMLGEEINTRQELGLVPPKVIDERWDV